MDNLRGLLGIQRFDKVPNTWRRELCEVTKRLVKVASGGSIMWREWKVDRIAKRVYIEECADSQLQKRWLDTVKDY